MDSKGKDTSMLPSSPSEDYATYTEELTNDDLDLTLAFRSAFRSVAPEHSSRASLGEDQDFMDNHFPPDGLEPDDDTLSVGGIAIAGRYDDHFGSGGQGGHKHVEPLIYHDPHKHTSKSILETLPPNLHLSHLLQNLPKVDGGEKEPWMNSIFLDMDKKKFLSSLADESASAKPQGGSDNLKLEPLPPYYEEYSSIKCKPVKEEELKKCKSAEEREGKMIEAVFKYVLEGLKALNVPDSKSKCNFRVKEDRNTIRGICYKDKCAAHWKMKIFRCRSNESEVAELVVEFSKRQGDTIAFHHFYTSLFNTDAIYEMKGITKASKDVQSQELAFGAGMDLPWPEDTEDDGCNEMDKDTVMALHAWATTELIDQRREGVRVLATLMEQKDNRNRFSNVFEKESAKSPVTLVGVFVEGFDSEDAEVQRLSSIALMHCAGDNMDEKIAENFSHVCEKFHTCQLRQGLSEMPLEAIQTYANLLHCLENMEEEKNRKIAQDSSGWKQVEKFMKDSNESLQEMQ